MDGSSHILLSQEEGNDMYKLTYDSDDNDEVIAPSTPTPGQRPSSAGYDTTNPMEKTETKGEISNNNDDKILSPNQKRTKDVGTYHGNGRFYSLFANDDFVTEDPKRKKKVCCIGVKSCLFISAIVILVLAILGMMWVVREVEIEQNHLRQRIKDLEDSDTNTSSSSSSLSGSADTAFLTDDNPQAPPGMAPPPPNFALSDTDQNCCTANKKTIDYLQEVDKGHAVRFEEIESKLKRHMTNDDIQNAQISRQLGETTIDVQTAISMITGVKENLHKVKALADTAQKLSLMGMNKEQLTDEQLRFYFETMEEAKNSEVVAFSVVHARNDDVTSGDTDRPTTEFYDIGENLSSSISFTDQTISGELYIPPESGTFHAPSDGNYVIMINFCYYDDEETTVNLIRNGNVVRKMKVSTKPELSSFYADDEGFVPPPELRRPPIPSNDDIGSITKKVQIRPYQFSELLSLDEGDTVTLQVAEGRIVEYKDKTSTCTRFSGFKLN